MSRLRRDWRQLVLIAAIVVCTGCRWGSNPYARDPLVQQKRAVPGELNAMPGVCPNDHPSPPAPPVEEIPAPQAK